jgi:hypothetical protein
MMTIGKRNRMGTQPEEPAAGAESPIIRVRAIGQQADWHSERRGGSYSVLQAAVNNVDDGNVRRSAAVPPDVALENAMQRWFAVITAVLVAGLAASPASAQTAGADSAPPLIAGRIALAEGDAQIWRVEEDQRGEWDIAQINDVVSIATGLHTGADGRIELRVGPHTFRLAAASRGGFSQLDYAGAVFNLEHGTANVRLAAPDHGEYTAVTLAGMRADLAAPGRYRIEVDANGLARITTFEGQAVVASGTGSITVGAGQAVSAAPNLASASLQAVTQTAFDQWALQRDARYQQVAATRYVSPYMTGYEELDLHGDWMPTTEYGAVWVPRAVSVGWAPYRYGQWRWVQPWGWTWVDHAPWGYAPFHYGRWVMIGNRWSWWPGGYVRRPVWAPALVGFVGGGGVSVSVSIGAPVVGWYPLAPWHRYRPHYPSNPTYVTIINQTIIHNPPRGVRRDINRDRGGTMVPGPRFRDPVMRAALPERSKFAQLQPSAPPPRNIARGDDRRARGGDDGRRWERRDDDRRARASDEGRRDDDRRVGRQPSGPNRTAPVGESQRPTRIAPPMTAQPIPGRGVAPSPALPGNDPAPLAQPPRVRDVPPRVAPRPQPRSDDARPAPRPHLPADQQPPGPRPRFTDPAEPARTPPGAPPTVRQPTRTAPTGDGGRALRPPRPAVATPAAPMPVPPAVTQRTRSAPGQEAGPPRQRPPQAERTQREARRVPSENVLRNVRESDRVGRPIGPRPRTP